MIHYKSQFLTFILYYCLYMFYGDPKTSFQAFKNTCLIVLGVLRVCSGVVVTLGEIYLYNSNKEVQK